MLPPRFDRFHGEYGRVVIDADAHEAVIGGHVVDAVRDRFADRISRKVVHVDQFGLSRWLPFLAPILEVADEFLLLGVDGDNRNAAPNTVLSCGVDMLELRVAIRMLCPSTDLFGACRL